MAEIDAITQRIETRIGCAAPLDFIEHVASLDESIIATHPAIVDRTWRLYGAGDLLASTRIDRHKGVQLDSVALYGLTLRDIGVTHLNGPEHLPIEFLYTTCSFADDNGDFLFISPDTSVWLFHHDGHEIQRISTSFSEFTDGIVWPRFLELAGSELNDFERPLVGRWCPVSSDTEDADVFDDLKHDLLLNADRTAKLIFIDEEADGTWHANSEHFVLTLQGHESFHTYRLDGELLDITTKKFGDHTRYERTSG